jgi:hypothetical protein
MQIPWIAGPLAQFAFLALTLAACLALSLSLKKEIDILRRSSRNAAAASAAALASELAALKREREGNEAPFVTGQDLSLTRRAQALRMHRRGESAATIAAALRVPRNEIDLLLKIQKLTTDRETSQ